MSAYSQEEDDEPEGGSTVNVTYVAIEKNVTLPDGTHVNALTWNGTIPGPTVRVTQGDVINVTIQNPTNSSLIHSYDTHASTISAVPNFGAISPGASKNFTFIATQPGVFKVHCEGNNVLTMDQHVFQGMVATMIVDPANGYEGYETVSGENGSIIDVAPEAKEVQFQFSEYYLDENGNYNSKAMFEHNNTSAWINGKPFGYDPVITKTPNATTLFFNQGDHVRFFLLNHGDIPVNFHMVGEVLDRVIDGSVVNGIGKQTYTIGGSNDAIVDIVFDKPGVYAFVNHDYAQLFKGQAGLVVVNDEQNSTSALLNITDNRNPSNAIPPQTGPNTISVDTKPYELS
jgi:nitrite reductase (NO-forming)